MKHFEKNCDYYAKVAPHIAIKLPYVDPSCLIPCFTKSQEPNLQESGKHFHSKSGALKEAKKWFAGLKLKKEQVLYIYGVGLGYYYEAAKKWLKKNRKRQIVFIEDDPRVLYRLFETQKGTNILRDPQVQIHVMQDNENDLVIFERLAWSHLRQPIKVGALKHYATNKKERYAVLQHKLHYDAASRSTLIDEYLNFGVPFYRNFYQNLLTLPFSYFGNRLFEKFKGVPAIICGAGPSLKKQLPYLKKIKNRALIFAGGSSLNALNYQNIVPHFGCGIDPNDEQYRRLSALKNMKIPFFYRNRMNHAALMTMEGPRLYLKGAGGYDTAQWFDEQLGLEGEVLDEGHNVINFSLEIAKALGCNPIIFVGMDLAYTDMKKYAPGVLKNVKLQLSKHADTKPFKHTDIYGKEVYTEWKWVTEAKWISDYAESHPELTLINATEGGIGFSGVPNKTMKELKFKKEYDLQILEKIEGCAIFGICFDRILGLVDKLQKSLEKCIEYLDILIKNKPLEKVTLAEVEIVDEIGYKYVLDIFNSMYQRVQFKEMQKSKNKAALDRRRYTFLKKTALVNLHLIKKALSKHK